MQAASAKELTWQEVIADEHAEEHKVIHNALHIEGKWQRRLLEFQLEVIPHQPAGNIAQGLITYWPGMTVALLNDADAMTESQNT